MSAYLRMLADRALGRSSPIRPPRPARLLLPAAEPTDPAGRPAVRAPLRPADTTSYATDDRPVQPMPRAPVADDPHTVADDASTRADTADLIPVPEAPGHEFASPAPAGDADGEFGGADERAPDFTPPVAERVAAPPTRIQVGAPAPVIADAPARNARAYRMEPATTGLDAAPEAAASTYIHIGRVELHATPPPPVPRAKTRPAHQPMPLEEYLRRRNGTPR